MLPFIVLYVFLCLLNFIFASHLERLKCTILQEIESYKQQISSLEQDKQNLIQNLYITDASKRSNSDDIISINYCINDLKRNLLTSENEIRQVEQRIQDDRRINK